MPEHNYNEIENGGLPIWLANKESGSALNWHVHAGVLKYCVCLHKMICSFNKIKLPAPVIEVYFV